MSNIILINHGTEIQIAKALQTTNTIDHLPAKVYTVHLEPLTGTLSLHVDRLSFDLPSKLYGDLPARRDIIWDVYSKRCSSTGVLLFGGKGMGKTVMAESLSNKAIGMGIPVIYIREKVSPDILYMLAKNLSPVVFLFDEFEKVYDECRDQQMLLTLFSDQDIKNQLYLVLGNDVGDIDTNYINRPGRFMFNIDYDAIDMVVAEQIIDDKISEGLINTALKLYKSVSKLSLNYDILQSVVNVASKLETLVELIEYMDIMNVPSLKIVDLYITAVELKTEVGLEYYSDVKTSYMDDNKEVMVVELYYPTSTDGETTHQKLTLMETLNIYIDAMERFVTNNLLTEEVMKPFCLTENIKIYFKTDFTNATKKNTKKRQNGLKMINVRESTETSGTNFPFGNNNNNNKFLMTKDGKKGVIISEVEDTIDMVNHGLNVGSKSVGVSMLSGKHKLNNGNN